MLTINSAIDHIRQAKSIEINQKVEEKKHKGQNVIVLSLGEAYFDIPDYGFSELNHEQGYHYSHSLGLADLRKKIVEYYSDIHKANNLRWEDNIIVSAGSKVLSYMAMLLTLEPGEEVLLHEPSWLSYEDQATLNGARVSYISYEEKVEGFHNYFTPETKLIVINNPNNPAGLVYSRESLESLIIQAGDRGIFVLVDEAYSDFVKQESIFFSCAELVNQCHNLMVINSMSKNFGMSGWRVGFMVANPAIIKSILKINQHLITCAPTILQLYLAKHLSKIHSACEHQIHDLMIKREKVVGILENDKVSFLQGTATFYFFLDIRNSNLGSDEFSNVLLEKHNVAVVPGSAYGRSTDNFIRISIGTESLENIEFAVNKIGSMLNSG